MLSLIIDGGTKEEREEKARAIIIKNKVSNFDQFILKEESYGINEIRNLQHWLSFSPYQSDKKVVLISQAEKLTIEAQNAFLKSLEEPPENTLIILLSSTIDFLLPTIVSRCQIINLSAKSQVTVSEKEMSLMIDNLMIILKKEISEKFKLAAEIAKSREEVIDWLDKEIFVLRKLMIGEKILPETTLSSYPIITSYPSLIRQFIRTKTLIQANINTRLSLENLFLNLDTSGVS